MKKIGILLLYTLIVSIALLSQTASPKWEDQIIYFVMIDRFANGDTTNDDLGYGEFGSDNAHYNGGDFAGLIEKLDYIKGLGVTAIWITPPVANQWWNPWVNYGGYHGYWARDFKKVDEHFGDLQLYKKFVEEAHKRGLYVIQDIVVNHVGDYFKFIDGEFLLNSESVPTSAPEQAPFSFNKYPEDMDKNIYHWTPDISDFADPHQKLNYQMSGLDDLNTENPVVIEALKDAYNFWIKEVGVDGFRIDTVIYVPHEFWKEFLSGSNGIYETARNIGKNDFITFGEAWVRSDPFNDTGEQAIKNYFEDGMNAMLDFPLNIEIRRVFKEGKATANLRYRLEKREEYEHPERLVTFVDNHDMERFLKGAGLASLKQALAFLFTLPGIPTIYYGTEQGFFETRAAMFKEGYASDGVDHYDTTFELYEFIKELTELRKAYPVFRYGKVTVLKDNPNGPGIFAFKISDSKTTAFVMLNTADERRIITNLETGLEPGTVIEPIYTYSILKKKYTVGEGGKLNITMNPRSFYVAVATPKRKSYKTSSLEIYPELKDGQKITGNIVLKGRAVGATSLKIIFDNRLDSSVSVDVVDGEWSYNWDISKFDPGIHTVVFKVYGSKRTDYIYSKDYRVVIDIPEVLLIEMTDPEGDDRGPFGRYLYPTDITFKRQMDLLGVRLKQLGGSLALTLKIKDLTTSWSPQNGFDHVTFQIYIDDPSKKGAKVLPYLNAEMPEGTDWDYFIFANGWSIVAYSSEDSGPQSFGTPIAPTPQVKTNKMTNEITLIISGDLLGRPDSYKGFKFYITTWDFDGIEAKYRDLYPQPKAYHFGGGTKTDPYIMDDIFFVIQ
ncbi:alpha-amylase family glycosyl hydrolase [Kosmotoga pacifica]|uniref:Alpha-amylase n=1 Tax=Kosmotoga pacifica TaxID=1330330 RepID=A0A0G2Z7R2_9BACT|nr:alpha-amylase family glycosyl hydrolase [Kosmotoga pacifica]AKI97587.1 alpha-amylase [Kosmotoga pacifica]